MSRTLTPQKRHHRTLTTLLRLNEVMPLAQAKARPSLAPSVPGLCQRATNDGVCGGALAGPSTPLAPLGPGICFCRASYPPFLKGTTGGRNIIASRRNHQLVQDDVVEEVDRLGRSDRPSSLSPWRSSAVRDVNRSVTTGKRRVID